MTTYTEIYVSPAGSGDGLGGDASNAMSFATAIADATANPCRYNLVNGAYTAASKTIATAGTAPLPRVWRGYNSTIGDLDEQGRDSTTGELIDTNFPVITVTGNMFGVKNYNIFQNLHLTCAASHFVVGSSSSDHVSYVSCKITNTSTGSGIFGDNWIRIFNCDVNMGTLGNRCIDVDIYAVLAYSRFYSGKAGATVCYTNNCTSIGCLFTGSSTSVGLYYSSPPTNLATVTSNTFYGLGDALYLSGSPVVSTMLVANNHATDCSRFINSTSTDSSIVQFNNRVRDNTSADTGVTDAIKLFMATTDTGGVETDFTDAPGGDFSLIEGAPGVSAGADMTGFMDIGAQQQEPAAGGGAINPFNGMIVS